MQNASAFILPKPSASSLGARRRLTSDGGRHVLGGRRLKTSKGRNRELEGPKGAIMGIWPTALAVAARAERRIDLDLSKPCDPSGVHDRFLNGGEHDGGAWEGVRGGSSGKRRRHWRTTSGEHERRCGAMSDALSIMMCRSRGHSSKSRAERAPVRTSR